MGDKGYTDFYYPPIGHIRVHSFPEFDNARTMAKEGNGYANEDQFQGAAAMWMWNTFPELRRTWMHPANEREIPSPKKDMAAYKKAMIKVKQDEAKGMLIGATDFVFLCPMFVIELKQPGGTLSEAQIKVKEACERCKIPWYLCEYMEDFQRIVNLHVDKIKWW